ncbi:hypothetical protein CAJCM15448_40820 [Candidozyma auris]|nr:hypothetical protein CAJCM15448_40820 [[Candida] auris]
MLKFATIASILAVALAADNPWATYPSVAKTASINGLADPIYDKLPECAKSCFAADVSSTPCPYWDTGCLCVMQPWSGPVAGCIADNCKGNDVVVATSLAVSQCSKVGVWEPYFIYPDHYSSSLSAAAAQTEVEPTSSAPAPSSSEEESSPIASATSSQVPSPAESSSPAITSSPAVSSDVVETSSSSSSSKNIRTASINGFADPIYDQLPQCAQPCVTRATSSTPCPYWDAGCLCVMSNWGNPVGECIAENCKGADVSSATDLAFSNCRAAGLTAYPEWRLGTSVISLLDAAAATAAATSAESSSSIVSVPVVNPSLSLPTEPTSSVAQSASSVESSAAASSAASSAAPSAESSAAVSSAASAAVSSAASAAASSADSSLAASSAASESNGPASTVTASSTHSEIVTITSCDENKCVETLSTVTKTNEHTKIVTITSCDDHKCVETLSTVTKAPAPKTTTVTAEPECITVTECIEEECKTYAVSTTQITTTVDKVETVYVSTCTDEIHVETSTSVSGTKTIEMTVTLTVPRKSEAAKSSAAVKTSPTSVAAVATSPAPAPSKAAPSVSTFEGAAVAAKPVSFGVAAVLMALPFF